MKTASYRTLQQFRETHKNCTLEYKLNNDKTDTVVVRCASHAQLITPVIPYSQFCLNIKECAGHNSCPRNYSCVE